jgi:hypothetical protein
LLRWDKNLTDDRLVAFWFSKTGTKSGYTFTTRHLNTGTKAVIFTFRD